MCFLWAISTTNLLFSFSLQKGYWQYMTRFKKKTLLVKTFLVFYHIEGTSQLLIKINQSDWESNLGFKLMKCSPLVFKFRSSCKYFYFTEHLRWRQARGVLLCKGNKNPEIHNFNMPDELKKLFVALHDRSTAVLATHVMLLQGCWRPVKQECVL